MTLNEYQRLAMRTSVQHDTLNDRMDNAILGLCGEIGELANSWKKYLYHSHEFSEGSFIDEIGDILWYVSQAAEALGVNLEEIAEYNIEKLRNRYPDGFSSERSINR